MIYILSRCQKEISSFPTKIREDLIDVLARLEEGHKLTYPLSRPMPEIANGVQELRLKDRTGQYRIIYFFRGKNTIYLLHAFKKKTRQTPQRSLEISRKRLKEILK